LVVGPPERAMANYIEDLSGLLQGFGVAAIALLVLPVLTTALTRNVPWHCPPACFLLPLSCFLLLLLLQAAVSLF
jgi:hypothetical protein